MLKKQPEQEEQRSGNPLPGEPALEDRFGIYPSESSLRLLEHQQLRGPFFSAVEDLPGRDRPLLHAERPVEQPDRAQGVSGPPGTQKK